MREILKRRRRLLSRRNDGRPELISAALTFATEWQWPVLPGVAPDPQGRARCGCPDPECTVPGAHPFDPGLLAATTDARMVRWWWANRPDAPALDLLDRRGMRLGPVIAAPTRWAVLVRPYSMEQLGELLYAKDFVPGSLRFHGEGGYLALPPSGTGQGAVRWERAPLPGSATPWVPDVEAVVDAVVDALTRTGVSAPEL